MMTAKMEMRDLDVRVLFASPTNPRKKFPPEKQKELEESIRESGVLEPLLVRPAGDRFEIVAGERRWKAAREVGMGGVMCVVREMSDEEVMLAQLAENVVRNELSPVEEWRGVDNLIEAGWCRDDVAAKLGVGARWVQDRLALGEVGEEARAAVDDGRLGLGAVREIMRVSDEEREGAVQVLLGYEEGLSVERVREFVGERYVEPRRRRRQWRAYWEGVQEDWHKRAVPCEDPELWSEYVRPWGEGTGKWRVSSLEIGGQAARDTEREVTWGTLAAAHGIMGVLVPVGGVVDEQWENVKLVVDSVAVLAAERAAREAGQDYTIGPKVAPAAGGGDDEESKEFGGNYVAKKVLPLDAFVGVELGEMELERARVAAAMLGVEYDWWKEEVEDELPGCDPHSDRMDEDALEAAVVKLLGGWERAAIWFVLRSGSPDDPRYRRLAELFGVLERWEELSA